MSRSTQLGWVKGEAPVKGIRLVSFVLLMLLAIGSGVAFAEQDEGSAESPLRPAPTSERGPGAEAGRFASSETFLLPSGQHETRIYPEPVSYRDPRAGWKPIGEGFRETGGETLTNGPNAFDLTLPKQIDSEAIRFGVGEQWVKTQLLRSDVKAADLEGDVASYEGEGNAPTFEFRALSNGLKEEVELTAASQPSSFAYDLSASADLRPSLEDGGAIAFRDEAGKTIVILPPPTMSDSAGAASRAVRYELGPEQDGHWKLSVIADRDWLEQPERRFPVRIDPTMAMGPTLDCVIGGHKGETGWIDCAAWGRENLLIGYTPKPNSAEDNWWRTLMGFETGAIPPNAEVSSASFHAHAFGAAQNTKGVELRKVTKPWTWQASWSRYDGPEHLWTTEGGDYSDLLGEVLTANRGSQAGWWDFSLPASSVEEEIAAEEQLPVMMKLIDDKVRECGKTSCTNRQVSFDSSSSEDEEDRPYLSVVYSLPSHEEPVAAYAFDEKSGQTAHDASGNGHDGTLDGAQWSAEGKHGGALQFDGEDDLLTVPPAKALAFGPNFTLEAWVRPSAAKPWAAVITKETPEFIGYQLLSETEDEVPGGLAFGQAGEAEAQGPDPLPQNTWTHLALTSDEEHLRLYVDGELVDTTASITPAAAGGPLQIGGDIPWEEDFFEGKIDDVRLYDRTLDAEEIEADEGLPVGAKAPSATTEAATSIGETGATFKGQVNPNGTETTYQFEYGTTTSYGSKVPTSPESVGAGTSKVAVSKAIGSLQEGTTYHYRVLASSEAGTSYGEDKVFTTLKLPTATTETPLYIGITEAVIRGSVNPNGTNTTISFEYGTTTAYGKTQAASPPSGSWSIPSPVYSAIKGLTEDTTYHYRVVATNAAGTVVGSDQTFTTLDPPETTITSKTPTYTSGEPQASIEFSSDQSGATFKCSLDEGESPKKTCSSSYSLPEHLSPGWHNFVVAATNAKGETDPTPAKYVFNPAIYPPAASTSKLISPEEGEKTASYYTLQAEWGSAPTDGGITAVTFQMKLYYWKEFRTIPAECVLDGKGKQVSWPLPANENPGHSDPVFLGVRNCALFKNAGYPEEDIKFRAVFDGGTKAAGASEPVATEFISTYGGVGAPTDAAEQVGPANLDLLTGQYTINQTDVSIPVPGSEATLEFARTYESNYRDQNVPSMVMGGMWQPSVPAELAAEGAAWTELRERHEDAVPAQYETECWEEEGIEECEKFLVEEAIPAADWVEVVDNEGAGASFEIQGGNYIAPDYMKEYVLTRHGEGASTTFELASPEGTHTVFVKNEVGYVGTYRAASVSWQATAKSARMVYEMRGEIGKYRLIKMIGPAPSGVTCSDSTATKTPGCRTLTFQYFKCTCDGWERLSSITYYNSSGQESQAKKVAEYEYDPKYRLVAEWDPRISPNLKETYSYDEWYKLQTLTPPGLKPWEFEYYDWHDFNLKGRLKSVSRATLLESPAPATAQTTIAYKVPISGSEAPYDLSPESVAEWGQSDYPVNATAIFPPSEVPESETPDDYGQATIHYMDPDGYEVNVASPQVPGTSGPSIATSETDRHGNVVRSLSAQNRLLALEDEDPATRSHELDSHSTYSADGTEMLESWGPLHKIRLESGGTAEARAHTVVQYDQNAPKPPKDSPPFALPTTETTSAKLINGEDVESRMTRTEYNWAHLKPTEVVVDFGGLNLRSKFGYDDAGQMVERTLPGAWSSPELDAHTTKTIYYSADGEGDSSCKGNPAYYGLPCKVLPAKQPGTLGQPELLVTKYPSYNGLDESTEVIESPGGKEEVAKTRKTIKTYDAGGREIISRQVGGGTELPPMTTVYNGDTGLSEEQKFTCEAKCEGFDDQSVAIAYDELGRPEQYTDADGSTSKTTYDPLGRPATIYDGKGTQAFGYDETTGLLVALDDSAAGTFTASYDADGKMVEQGLPNGLVAKTTYDEAGQPVGLSYTKVLSCTEKCTWLEESNERSIRGQILSQTSLFSSQQYSYDKAGRLTLAQDTTGGSCTTRQYFFDADSNRTKMTTRAPGIGGACDTKSSGSSQEYEYDKADRLIGPETINYDSFGRITKLPSKWAGGNVLETIFYSNEMVASQSQGGLTNTYQLDATGRPRQVTQTGTKTGIEVFHYAMASDSVAWTERGAAWTRNIDGINGNLAAIQESSGNTSLQLTNLHGDVVATASLSSSTNEPIDTFEFDEFGNPKKGTAGRYGWLGGKARRTELPSGAIQMGVRSYIPALGRFISVDPVLGSSANAYDYANQDPVDNFDLTGECPNHKHKCAKRQSLRKRQRVSRASHASRAPRAVYALHPFKPVLPPQIRCHHHHSSDKYCGGAPKPKHHHHPSGSGSGCIMTYGLLNPCEDDPEGDWPLPGCGPICGEGIIERGQIADEP